MRRAGQLDTIWVLFIFYFTPLLLGGDEEPRSGWPTCHDTHFFFRENCLVWPRLSVSARSPSIGKTDQKGEQTAAVCCREPSRSSSSRQTASLPDRRTASRPVGQDPQTLLRLSAVRKWGKHIRGHCAACRIPVTPTPSENIIDLEIKRAARLQIGFHACLILPVRFFRRPDSFLHPPPPPTESGLTLRAGLS